MPSQSLEMAWWLSSLHTDQAASEVADVRSSLDADHRSLIWRPVWLRTCADHWTLITDQEASVVADVRSSVRKACLLRARGRRPLVATAAAWVRSSRWRRQVRPHCAHHGFWRDNGAGCSSWWRCSSCTPMQAGAAAQLDVCAEQHQAAEACSLLAPQPAHGCSMG